MTENKIYDNEVIVGLCAGRHDLPVSDYIFEEGDITFPINPDKLYETVSKKFKEKWNIPPLSLDNLSNKFYITVYVTGLTPAALAVIKYCLKNGHRLTFKHYNRDSGDWIDDVILADSDDCTFRAGMPAWQASENIYY